MTPKEKAQELVDKNKPFVYCFIGSGMLINQEDDRVILKNAKQCALIAVDEMIAELTKEISPSIHGFRHNYWRQVKNEIELL